ncbi:cell envelope integrity protein CreD [uncultured Flavobacterium sp.]|uniref:cell envelope integrity protein CreD n=1 Tax=uncultured Flavobacterium sp. TaxID=165435 RepID=UPI0030ED5B7D|tara:strand:+ start:4437 stop:5789 length:1353 start_codon:yes stop_codon:yes gene_type:complete
MENQTQLPQQKPSFFQSNTAKMIMVGLLCLFLLIPLELVKGLISERSQRKKEMTQEVNTLWGSDIKFYGPVLSIPYYDYESYNVEDVNHNVTIQTKKVIKQAYFFPEILNNYSNIKKSKPLKRGLYENVVFTSIMDFDGNFEKPNFEKLDINPESVIWDKASIIVNTSNLKSIKSDLNIALNNQPFAFESKANNDSNFGTLESNLFDYKALQKEDKITFKFQMKFNGSNSVQFIPVGKTTNIKVDSDWNSPSLMGTFAANEENKKIDSTGFHAEWKILDINRSFSQQHTEKMPNLNEYLFGVKLLETVDQYQQNERASKYGFLVIGLTFLVFFLIQSISKINIHIFQYTMIGLALVMFYTLLISITEHSTFSIAYIIAAIGVIVMIVLYSISILKDKKFPLFIGISLTALYTFIFVIIQLEDYALLVGSIGLFAILGAVMYFSKKIDWNS